MNNTTQTEQYKGSCLCQGTQFYIKGQLDEIVMCHCIQCRKITGHFMAATRVVRDEYIVMIKQDTLSWYDSSSYAKRGFCNVCGATMFYKNKEKDGCSISMGVLDDAPKIPIKSHIFCRYKADYYQITDDVSLYDERD